MKNILLIVAFLISGAMFAQETKDKKEETETKTVKVKSEKGTVEKKVKVTTTEEGETELKKDPNHYENMDIADTNKKVTKRMSIEYDHDPFYAADATVQYYTYNGNQYMFKPNTGGFVLALKDDTDPNSMGMARLSSMGRLYLVDMGKYNGVGYFKHGKFIVEYYDRENDTMVVQEFEGMNQ